MNEDKNKRSATNHLNIFTVILNRKSTGSRISVEISAGHRLHAEEKAAKSLPGWVVE